MCGPTPWSLSAGIPVIDVPFVTVGGGIGSFVTLDYLRIAGVRKASIRCSRRQRDTVVDVRVPDEGLADPSWRAAAIGLVVDAGLHLGLPQLRGAGGMVGEGAGGQGQATVERR